MNCSGTSRRIAAIAFASLLAPAVTPVAASPAIGDKAPKVVAEKWYTTRPPALPGEEGARKHVFLVEFWATWCPPCLRSIPHLNDLHKKHAKDGLVVIGLSNEEASDIEPFVKDKAKMEYHVGSDSDMATWDPYMSDVEGIPHAYVVDRNNIVVWSGNPLDTRAMDHVIEQVLAGKFDVQAAMNAAAAEKKFEESLVELRAHLATRDAAKCFEIADKLLAVQPPRLQGYMIKRNLLKDFDRASEIPAFDELIEKTFRDSENDLRDLVEVEYNRNPSERNAGMMFRAVVRLNELTKGREATDLAMLAQIQSEMGLLDEAIRNQEQAVQLIEKEAAPHYEKVLAYYKSIKRLADEYRAKNASAKQPADDH